MIEVHQHTSRFIKLPWLEVLYSTQRKTTRFDFYLLLVKPHREVLFSSITQKPKDLDT